MPSSHEAVKDRIDKLYHMLFNHSGYGEMVVEIRYLRKHEKEVIIRCGKQYRFVVPFDCSCDDDTKCNGSCGGECGPDCECQKSKPAAPGKAVSKNDSLSGGRKVRRK